MENYSFFVDNVIKTQNNILGAFEVINNAYYIIFSLILIIGSIILFSYRFKIAVNKINNGFFNSNNDIQKFEIPFNNLKFHDAMLFTVLGGIANTFGIGKLGIPAKTVLLKKKGYSTNISVASIAVDTTFDIIISILILILAIIYLPSIDMVDIFDIRIIVISSFVIILIIAKFRNRKWLSIFINTIKKIDLNIIFELFLLTLMAWLLTSLSYYFLIKSTNENVNLFDVFAVFNFSVVIGIISPIAGGIGVREGMLTFLSTTINIEPSKGLLIAILYRILSVISLLFLLLIGKLNKINHMIVRNNENDFASENKRDLKAKKIISILQKEITIENKTILEIGSGYGYIINQFQKRGSYAIGIDKSINLVRSAKNNNTNCEYICGDGALIPIEHNSIDVIILNHVIEHIKYKEKLMKECNRILRKEGVIYIATPNKHFFLDPHTKIPFFGYMSEKIHDRYNIHNPSRKEMIELFKKYELSYKYLSLDIISHLNQFEEYNILAYKLFSIIFKYLSFYKIQDYLIPTHIFIIKKK